MSIFTVTAPSSVIEENTLGYCT